ncbi:hypothetical protein GCM10009634_48830 [Saccharothrix xinjiangensis]
MLVAVVAIDWVGGGVLGGGVLSGGAPAWAAVAAFVLLVSSREPVVAFLLAVPVALASAGSFALLACTAYRAGRRLGSRRDLALVLGGTTAHLVALLTLLPVTAPGEAWVVLARVVALVGVPVLAGRHVRRERLLLAERERLGERLRIARDVHDSLGHLLGVVSVQAAALEVAPLPPEQRVVVRDIARAARAAVDELHTAVAALRAGGPGLERVDEVVARFRRAGLAVTVERSGAPRPLARAAAGDAAHRVCQEGLTNAAKHAPGAPVTLTFDWQPDALLLSVVNPGSGRRDAPPGTGLLGLSERVEAAGGLLRVHDGPDVFRVVAVLPLVPDPLGVVA